jgi:hypothetical protein
MVTVPLRYEIYEGLVWSPRKVGIMFKWYSPKLNELSTV